MSHGVLKFKNFNIQKQQGELGRLRVIGGQDYGTLFVIVASRITLGRAAENNLTLSDIKVSRKHAEIIFNLNNNLNTAFIHDLKSSHGVFVNGKQLTQSVLKTGDKVGLGETVLEFIGSDALSEQYLMSQPNVMTSKVGTGMSGLTQFIERPSAINSQKHTVGRLDSFFEKNKKIVLVLMSLIGVATLLPTVEQKSKKRNIQAALDLKQTRSISSIQPVQVNDAVKKNADQYFRSGFREFRAKNYLRAQVAFETALQIYSEHTLARIYLENTKSEMEKEAKSLLENAKRDEEANRFRGAKLKYDAVKRLYMHDQVNDLYKEADAKVEDLEKKVKEDEGQ